MITINVTWHLCLMIVLEIIGIFWVISCDDTDGFLGSERGWAWIAYIFISIIGWLIYGGFVWW